jgi:hypothetical protein
MRIRNQEAEQRAIAIAEAFLKKQEAKGWSHRCLGASPNLFVPDNKHRKTYIKWSVLFDSRPPGSTFDDGSVHDGPFMIHVNILTEEVEYF